MNIDSDKIRDVIGPGGKTIRSIVQKTGVKIDIADDGVAHMQPLPSRQQTKPCQ